MAGPGVRLRQLLAPRAGVRAQLFVAATLWLCALSFLLVRGVQFLDDPAPGFRLDSWFLPTALVAAVLGTLKARFVLRGYARKVVARIHARGRACVFGLFSWRSWLFVAGMITAGVALRNSPLTGPHWGRVLLCGIYLAVGTALLLADGVFWSAALRGTPPSEA